MTKAYVDQLKGVAILLVVAIHFLANLPEAWWYTEDTRAQLMIGFDQFGRICVPLFMFVSWYGLAKKYQDKQLKFKEFLVNRVLKLLPLYVLWSVSVTVLLNVIPGWDTYLPNLSLFERLLLGQGDYHLYFVPLLVVLYLVFALVSRWPLEIVAALSPLIVFIQLKTMSVFSNYSELNISGFFPADQAQYLLPLSWIWYAWMGLVAARSSLLRRYLAQPWFKLALLAGALFFLRRAISEAELIVEQGFNVLSALRFTRLKIVEYASVALIFLASRKQALTIPLASMFETLGQHSYLIYLSHTLLLRLTIAQYYHPIQIQWWLLAAAAFVVLVVCSHFLSKHLANARPN